MVIVVQLAFGTALGLLGWATFPGDDKANKSVAKACAVLLSELELT